MKETPRARGRSASKAGQVLARMDTRFSEADRAGAQERACAAQPAAAPHRCRTRRHVARAARRGDPPALFAQVDAQYPRPPAGVPRFARDREGDPRARPSRTCARAARSRRSCASSCRSTASRKRPSRSSRRKATPAADVSSRSSATASRRSRTSRRSSSRSRALSATIAQSARRLAQLAVELPPEPAERARRRRGAVRQARAGLERNHPARTACSSCRAPQDGHRQGSRHPHRSAACCSRARC